MPVEDDALALANVAIPAADIPIFSPIAEEFVRIDLSPFPIFLTPGDVLAIVLRYFDGGSYVWLGQVEELGETHVNGVGYARRFSPTWGPLQPETGFGFQTFVVPEPTTLTLLGIGLAGLGFTRRKIRRGVAQPEDNDNNRARQTLFGGVCFVCAESLPLVYTGATQSLTRGFD